jgi:putative phage-type endonuclease
MPGTDEWYAARSTGIGASEAAAACGRSTYETPLHVYARKIGELAETRDNEAMYWGRVLEPLVLTRFVQQAGLVIEDAPCPMFRSDSRVFQLATPDAILADGTLVEIKTTNWRRAKQIGDEGSDAIPDEWLMQCQQQMAVVGADLVHVAVLIDGRNLWTGRVERNDALIGRMTEIEGDLWGRVETRRPPEPNWEHGATRDLVRSIHSGVVDGKVVDLAEDIAAAWRRQKDLAESIKSLEDEREALRSRVMFAMGDAAVGCAPDGLELVRKVVAGGQVFYERKPYTTLREGKRK